jgi:ribonuclease HI
MNDNKSLKKIEIYTDGSCLKNPGCGACAFLIIDHFNQKIYSMSKYYDQTTNNQMEMLACVHALKNIIQNQNSGLSNPDAEIVLHTDSQYLKNGINDWIVNWKKNNWKTAAKSPVKNQEIWIEIDQLNQKIKPRWEYVKAHSYNLYNNFVDRLANSTAKLQRDFFPEEIKSIFDESFNEILMNNFKKFSLNF